jgi:hypothetical protein
MWVTLPRDRHHVRLADIRTFRSADGNQLMPRLPNRAQRATVVQPSRLDAAMNIAKGIPNVR